MHINRVKKTVSATTNKIRRHWSREEKQRREQMAELMQTQLLTVLGFQPAPVRAAKSST